MCSVIHVLSMFELPSFFAEERAHSFVPSVKSSSLDDRGREEYF